MLEADLGAPRKQRHTAKRACDRLVEERGYGGSYPTVRRHVAEWRREHSRGGGEGYLEPGWEPGTAQVDFGNFRCVVAGVPTDEKLLVAALPHSNDRRCVALPSERSECMCDGLRSIFEQLGRAPRTLVPGDACVCASPDSANVHENLSAFVTNVLRLRAWARRRTYLPDFPSMREFSSRWLGPPNSTSLPWRATRPAMAAASSSSANTVPHLPDSTLVASATLLLS